ncbi:MAG TPA: YciI family protein [Bryobacteraceae bacterium]|jgi:hypothetical protein|nr:YciI family protein [Bryobacteraceae bacterium]
MKYLCLIYIDEAARGGRSQTEQKNLMAEYYAFTDEIRNAGAYRAGEALHPTSTATTVRVRKGTIQTTDGPFAETKEQLGGYYLLECKDLDEAIQWAAKIPNAKDGCVEIRPVVDFSQVANA